MKITDLSVENNVLSISLEDGRIIQLEDIASYCCEKRYMTCDDDLDYYVGSEYIDWETRKGQSQDHAHSDHDVCFLIVNTSRGSFTVANHNIHNGYYSGFDIREYIN